jgi:hypothetical protein
MFCKGPNKSEAPRGTPASKLLVGRRSGLGDLAVSEELVVVAHLLGRGAHDAAGSVDVGTVGVEGDEAGAAAVLGVQEHLVAAGAAGLDAGVTGDELGIGVAGLLEHVDGVGRGAAGRQAADCSDGGERQSDKTGAHSDSP